MRNLVICLFTIFILLSACTTTKFVPVTSIETEYITKYNTDTIIQYDSVDRLIKEDTVFIYKYKYIYKGKAKVDTVIKTDTILVPYEVKITEVKEVNKLKWYLSLLMCLGGIFIVLLSFRLGRVFKR